MPRGGTGEPPITEPLEFLLPGPDGIVVYTRWDPDEEAHVYDCHLCGMVVRMSKHGDNTNLLRHWESRINGRCSKAQRKKKREANKAAEKVCLSIFEFSM